MGSYILKYDVNNNIVFPKGTVVIVLDPNWEFEVIEGALKGKKGHIADGMNGWLIEDTEENRHLFNRLTLEKRKLEKAIYKINRQWDEVPTSNF